jgi:hypothetical protein
MLDQDVTRADFLGLQKRRSRERLDLFFRQAFRRLPDRLLRRSVVVIRHPARIREANFPARLCGCGERIRIKTLLCYTCTLDASTYHARRIDGS